MKAEAGNIFLGPLPGVEMMTPVHTEGARRVAQPSHSHSSGEFGRRDLCRPTAAIDFFPHACHLWADMACQRFLL